MRTITCFGDRTSGTFLVIASVSDEKKTYQKGKEKKKTPILHGWESREQQKERNMKMGTITCFGDRTSGAFLIIASVSRTNITRSHGPITL